MTTRTEWETSMWTRPPRCKCEEGARQKKRRAGPVSKLLKCERRPRWGWVGEYRSPRLPAEGP